MIFIARINSDLVGKYINIASRTAGFITNKFDGKLASQIHPSERSQAIPKYTLDSAIFDYDSDDDDQVDKREKNDFLGFLKGGHFSLTPETVLGAFNTAGKKIHSLYEKREYAKTIREIMFLADVANQYIDHEKPWELAKPVGQEERLHEVCTTNINLFRSLLSLFKTCVAKSRRACRKISEHPSINVGWRQYSVD